MAEVTYVEDPAALRWFLGWEGPPGQDFTRRLRTLAYRHRTGAPKRTGRMAGEGDYRRMGSDPPRYLEAASGVRPGTHGQVGYADYQAWGTRPHIIVARRARALRFYWPVVGKVVYRRSVMHPGTAANPFLTRHLNEFVR